ncbi:MAG: CDP-diacylglycerol--serine O-phosphatidyltransferase [Rhodospirillales bacterium]|nr:MAG: CDP-diacylglycerol--serine O-phosphatidyltransferase [Rhodospirillales bacterium]
MKLRRKRSRKLRRLPRLKGQSVSKLIPHIITVGAACAGLTAIKYAIDARWESAVIAIVVAAVLDALDGRMARLLNAASDFGAELDSLSDFVAFGVAPAFIMYFWSLQSLGRVGWIVALFLAICCGLRLARFNTNIGKLPPYAYNYFTGVPAPGGAGLAILPLIGTLAHGAPILREPVLVAIWSVIVAILMVSRVPTFSLKRIKVPQTATVPLLVFAALLIAGMAGAPWLTLTVVGLLYIMSFGVSVLTYRRLKAEAERMHGERAQHDDAGDDEDGDTTSSSPMLRTVE